MAEKGTEMAAQPLPRRLALNLGTMKSISEGKGGHGKCGRCMSTTARTTKYLHIVLASALAITVAHGEGPYGDPAWEKMGIMDGNLVRTIFLNHGEVALWPFQPSCEWPKGSGQSYIDGVAMWVAAETVDIYGDTIHPLETNYREYVDYEPETGKVWGWYPLPGYANLSQDYPAMSNDPRTWPYRWPDQPEWYNKETGEPYWNGYFGMGVKNADLETYFVMDDAYDKEFAFYPDSTDSSRGGLGLRVAVRGFQWSHVWAEDVIFWHYDIRNIGTTDYKKTLFGMYIDFGIGGTRDSDDDQGEYDPILDITFAWDGNGIGDGGWAPVGVAGYAFLESPGAGNVYIYDEMGNVVETKPGDGIDNDDDGLVDESRNNPRGDYVFGPVGIYGEPKWHWEGDEDGDWDSFTDLNGNGVWDEGEPLNDDLGADGVGPTDEQYPGPDLGEGDGKPTDGEPDFNRTDKDESDQIGLTSVKLYNLHAYDLWMDEEIWNVMAFGMFDPQEGDVNLGALYSSGPFSLEAGQTERFSMALLFGEDTDDLLRNKKTVQAIYNAGYNFAKPPKKPMVTAVAGDRKVTLYWDRSAETSYDRYIDAYDFEGYRIYRSTDPAFLETKIITDAYGNKTYRKPIFQCDLVDYDPDSLWWVKGTHPADINGVQFDMGDDTGLIHAWTDTTVRNGQTYYYAVVSYDQGLPPAKVGGEGLPPNECTSIIKIDDLGNVVATDINTVAVTPNAPAAGYRPPELLDIVHTDGPGTGFISVDIVDPGRIKENHTYEVRFHHEGLYETTSYSVYDITNGTSVVIVDNSPYVNRDSLLVDPLKRRYEHVPQEGPVFDGLRIFVYNDTLAVEPDLSGWLPGSKSTFIAAIRRKNPDGIIYPADYEIRFFDDWVDTSTNGKPARFKVWNVTEQKWSDFYLKDANGNGIPDDINREKIYIWEPVDGTDRKTWEIFIGPPKPAVDTVWVTPDSMVLVEVPVDTIPPSGGDVFLVHVRKPFRGDYGTGPDSLKGDIFQFTTKAASVDRNRAKGELERIAVVPNPYVVTASWEPKSLFSTGRGPRFVEFIHLPKECTIRIYTVRGYLVDTIYHNKDIDDGSEFWDLRSKDGMDIAYGLYIYHVEAPGIGEKIGKFAVVK
jgi:hypothetical protein